MSKHFLILLCALAFGATMQGARAQISTISPGGMNVPAFGIFCNDGLGNAKVCTFGGGTGGAVTQSGAWTVGISSLPALPAGSNAIGSVSVSNLPATQAVSAVSLPLPAGAATSAIQSNTQAPVAPATATAAKADLIGCIYNTTAPTFTTGQQGAVACDSSGRPLVDVATGVLAMSTQISSSQLAASSTINAAASGMPTAVKASGGALYSYRICNANSSAVYVRLFNSATAPTLGSGTPVERVLVPASGGCLSWNDDVGVYYSAGIAFDVTTGSLADTDTATITTANTVSVNLSYK